MNNLDQDFLNELDKKLWDSANRLRASLDAANYKHVVLGLIFLKYVSDAFEEQRQSLKLRFNNPLDEYYLPDQEQNNSKEYEAILESELEQRDYYTASNVFWVPREARWETLKACAILPAGEDLPWTKLNGAAEKMRSVGWLVDNALEAIELENEKLKGILNRIASYQVTNETLIGLINSFSDTSFHKPEYKGRQLDLKSKDILGHVYEYFLGEFALAEGKKGGQYFTPKSIVTLIVEMLRPYKGRIYDPAMGSGGFFVQSERFIEAHRGKINDISVYGQEANPTTWRLAAMNMSIRGIDFNFGKRNADSFLDDQHPDLRADYVMANPPFNLKEWWNDKLENDPRWVYGIPPASNANFAWMQHMLFHLSPTGSMALLLANGSMSSTANNEGEIRKAIIEKGLVECMVALPGQLFTNTQIPACIWLLTKDKSASNQRRQRHNEVLFIDARNLGYMKDRVLRDFTGADIKKIASTFHNWQRGIDYTNEPGFCFSATLADIRSHDYMLTAGRYVEAKAEEIDQVPFAEKMLQLTHELEGLFKESALLKDKIELNLKELGYSYGKDKNY
jgi:type I restriction enzyme M protein